MEPVYESIDHQPMLEILLVLVGIGMVVMAFFVPQDPTAPAWIIWVMCPVLVFFGLLTFVVVPRIRIRAYPEYIEIRYGFTNLVRFRLDYTKITSVEAVKYNPLIEFGGWGIKGGYGKYAGYTAFTASITNTALAIRTTEKNYIIGCPDPQEAETMIRNLLGTKK